jgi:NodT family efflux transporter outer membrane factor (OMF) lipoprotein
MMRQFLRHAIFPLAASTVLLLISGCTSMKEYVHNGFKVGPNYAKPNAEVAEHWINENDIRVRQGEDLSRWWTVFNDDRLNYLVHHAYRQNLTLKEAGFRVLAARATLAIAKGGFFPQTQTANGAYTRSVSDQIFNDTWSTGFNLSWELDFWGRLRRAIASADDSLEASVENYDDVLVTLLGDVATNYVNIRTYQKRIELYKGNVALQQGVFDYIQQRYTVGYKVDRLDLEQAKSNLRQVEAQIPSLEIGLQQTENALCVLLGMPPKQIHDLVSTGPIPTAPTEVVIGIPAELLRRRPDVRMAERTAAAQAEQIGIAQAKIYPTFSLNGSVGYAADSFKGMFNQDALVGSFGPSFQWNIFNYGRLINNVRYQDAYFQQLVATYQQTVLNANQEVEDGIVTFVQSRERTRLLDESVEAAQKAVTTVITKLGAGTVDFNRYATIAQALVTQQDTDATATGNIALGLITVYRAMGGGWEIRLNNEPMPELPPEDSGVQHNPNDLPTPISDVLKKSDIKAPKAPDAIPKPQDNVVTPIDSTPAEPENNKSAAPTPPPTTKGLMQPEVHP